MSTVTKNPASPLHVHGASQFGQSSLEYVVVCCAIAFALGVGMHDDGSILKTLLDGFNTGYQNISFALSLPM